MRLIERKQWKKITPKDENKEIAMATEGEGDEVVHGRRIERGERKLPIKLINCVRMLRCKGEL
jgi:hypothetical protein